MAAAGDIGNVTKALNASGLVLPSNLTSIATLLLPTYDGALTVCPAALPPRAAPPPGAQPTVGMQAGADLCNHHALPWRPAALATFLSTDAANGTSGLSEAELSGKVRQPHLEAYWDGCPRPLTQAQLLGVA